MNNPEELDRFLETLTHEQEGRFWQIRITNSLLNQVRLREDSEFYLALGMEPVVAPAIAAEWVPLRRDLENLMEILAQGADKFIRNHPWDVREPYSLPYDLWCGLTRQLGPNEPKFQDLDLFKDLFGKLIGYYSGDAQNDLDKNEEEWRQFAQNESDYNNWLNQFGSPNSEDGSHEDLYQRS